MLRQTSQYVMHVILLYFTILLNVIGSFHFGENCGLQQQFKHVNIVLLLIAPIFLLNCNNNSCFYHLCCCHFSNMTLALDLLDLKDYFNPF